MDTKTEQDRSTWCGRFGAGFEEWALAGSYSFDKYLKSPEAKAIYKEAWKACPPEIQKEIDAALQAQADGYGRKLTEKVVNRFYVAREYLDGNLETYRKDIADRMDTAEWVAEALAERAKADAEKEARLKAERAERLAAWNTPEVQAERERKQAEHDKRRWEKAARDAVQAAALGRTISPRGRCLYCKRKLDDPVSMQRGFGSQCWPRVLAFLRAVETGDMDITYLPDWLAEAMNGSN